MSELSDLAKETVCGLFFFGMGTVKSSPPHSTVSKNREVFDELIMAGLITRKPFNKYDVWLYEPTPAMPAEAAKLKHWYYSRHLPKLPESPDPLGR